uniref:Peptidase M12A domain-containing protein n=2 Tax=Panagrolaimus davidi TaxID=227884 RepID=A0A914QIK8_9BILA
MFVKIFLFVCIWVIGCYGKRGKRIDIYSQSGGSDIAQLKLSTAEGGAFAAPPHVMFNALPSSSSYRWTVYTDVQGNYVLPYIITGNFDDEELAIIQSAMKAIENNTCLRFQKRKNEKDYLDLQNERNQGCYTTVGRQSGKNVVMLEANALATCVEHDIVVSAIL